MAIAVLVIAGVAAMVSSGRADAWNEAPNISRLGPSAGATFSATSHIAFSWHANPYPQLVNGWAYQLHFQIATDPGFSSLVVDRWQSCHSPADCPSISTEGPFTSGTYYWRVTSDYEACLSYLAARGVVQSGAANFCQPQSSEMRSFVVPPPKVTSVSPASAAAGSVITLLGQNLGSTVSVDFAGHPGVSPTSVTATAVKVFVPADAVTGALTLRTARAAVTTASVFKPLPRVSWLDSYDGQAGDPVRIFGSNLVGLTSLKFGGVAVTPTANTPTEVDANVPGGTFSSGRISVTTPGGTTTSAQAFAITKVSGLVPAAARAGATVTLTGQGLGSVTTVTFPGAGPVPVTAATATSLRVVVPTDATVGPLTVNTPRATASTATGFKPLAKIGGFGANPVQAGDSLLISGSNFLPTGTTPTVKIGTAMVPVAAASPTSLQVVVPDAGLPGPVTVTTPDGTTTSPLRLNVSPTINNLSISNGVAGTPVTLTGKTFSGTTSVKFANNAPPRSWSAAAAPRSP
jgi:hypothetical protein